MTDTTHTPWHLWVVGIATLLFNTIGCYSYLMTQTGSLAELGMTPEQIGYFDTFPAWADAAWALGVWGALLGSVRRSRSRPRKSQPIILGSMRMYSSVRMQRT